jgi:hypothetical protein
MPDNKRLIDDILDAKEAPKDTSLRGNALRRAISAEVPKTMTAWEWEEYYRTHGRPDTHMKPSSKPHAGFLHRVRAWLSR